MNGMESTTRMCLYILDIYSTFKNIFFLHPFDEQDCQTLILSLMFIRLLFKTNFLFCKTQNLSVRRIRSIYYKNLLNKFFLKNIGMHFSKTFPAKLNFNVEKFNKIELTLLRR